MHNNAYDLGRRCSTIISVDIKYTLHTQFYIHKPDIMRSNEQNFYSHYKTVIKSQATASLSHAHKHTRAYGLMQSVETRYHTDPHTQLGSTHLLQCHVSSSQSSPPPHSLLEKGPPGNTSAGKTKQLKKLVLFFKMCRCLQILTRPYTSPFHQPL